MNIQIPIGQGPKSLHPDWPLSCFWIGDSSDGVRSFYYAIHDGKPCICAVCPARMVDGIGTSSPVASKWIQCDIAIKHELLSEAFELAKNYGLLTTALKPRHDKGHAQLKEDVKSLKSELRELSSKLRGEVKKNESATRIINANKEELANLRAMLTKWQNFAKDLSSK